jgi:RimJ/RimL family protein N-acetyltransferase
MSTMPNPVELRTKRLLLRPVQASDAEDLFGLGSDEEFAYFYLAAPGYPQSVEILREHIAKTSWDERPSFAVALGGMVVGEAYLNINHFDLVGEIGYAISREKWGKGLGLEAAQAVLNYGFEDFKLAKIFAVIDPRNVRSMRVLLKLRMKQEGILGSHVIRRGERTDQMYFGLLRKDWEAMK